MNRIAMRSVWLIVAGLCCRAGALEPNNVETTVFDVDENQNNIVTTEYSNGLGRAIQTKMRIADNPNNGTPILRDRVSCTFYDDAGRPQITTKPFVDSISARSFLPGDLTNQNLATMLSYYNKNDSRAFTETEYWDDPSGQARTVTRPGNADRFLKDSSWIFGVGFEASDRTINLQPNCAVVIKNGLITEINHTQSTKVSEVLDALHSLLLSNNPYGSNITHLLSVTLAIDDATGTLAPKISEEVKDNFGSVVGNLTMPKINATGTQLYSSYDFDISGNLRKMFPPFSATHTLRHTEYTYNTLGQMVTKKLPDVDGIYRYTYFDNGLLASQELVLGVNVWRRLNYTYDIFGRQTKIEEVFMQAEPRVVIESYYDYRANIPDGVRKLLPAGVLSRSSNVKGRLICSVAYNYVGDVFKVVKFYSYDVEGRNIYTATAIEGVASVSEAEYHYDTHGKVLFEFNTFNYITIKKKYAYDALGRLSKITHCQLDGDPVQIGDVDLVAFNYDDFGNVDTTVLSIIPDFNIAKEFDLLGRVTAMTKPANKPGFNEKNINYSKGGNIMGADYEYEVQPGVARTPQNYRNYSIDYGYDDLSRLTQVTSSEEPDVFSGAYTYDKVGRFDSKLEGTATAYRFTNYTYYGNATDLYSSRLKSTSKAALKEYIYTPEGNLWVDFTKNMITDFDWRNLPKRYCFYNDLTNAAITKNDATGTLQTWQLNSRLRSRQVRLLSSVVMLYDADGNRVCKLDNAE